MLTDASKLENTVQHAVGWSSIQVPSRTLAKKSCGWRVERGSPVWAHAPNFVTDRNMYIEKKLSSPTSLCTFMSRRKSGRSFVEMLLMEKKAKLNEQLCYAHIRWRSRCAQECAQSIPSALKHPQIRSVFPD